MFAEVINKTHNLGLFYLQNLANAIFI